MGSEVHISASSPALCILVSVKNSGWYTVLSPQVNAMLLLSSLYQDELCSLICGPEWGLLKCSSVSYVVTEWCSNTTSYPPYHWKFYLFAWLSNTFFISYACLDLTDIIFTNVSISAIDSFSVFCPVKAMSAFDKNGLGQSGQEKEPSWSGVCIAVLVLYGFKSKIFQLLILGT